MQTLSKWLSRFCYNHPKLAIPGLMKYIVIGNVFVYLMDLVSRQFSLSSLLCFIPGAILQGQVWRLFTFVFVPTNYGNPLFFVLFLFCYYSLGTQLEQIWGSTRFTVYYGLGVLLNILTGFVIGLGGSMGMVTADMYYVNLSLFLAFATLFPDAQFLIMYIIPVKAKWLAWLDAALFAFDIFARIGAGRYLMALLPVVAIFNYLLFFWGDLMSAVGRGRTQTKQQTWAARRTIDLKAARRQVEKQGYLHKCAVCGATDNTHPNMEFRYCSKCEGYHCYCAEHINNHVHVK